MYTYDQLTGALVWRGAFMGEGYSGAGDGKNNPSMQAVPDVGPIPQGRYSIGAPFDDPKRGPCVMRLTPVGHDALGRTGFLIHGDSIANPGTASKGCVILPHDIREAIATNGDIDFEVEA